MDWNETQALLGFSADALIAIGFWVVLPISLFIWFKGWKAVARFLVNFLKRSKSTISSAFEEWAGLNRRTKAFLVFGALNALFYTRDTYAWTDASIILGISFGLSVVFLIFYFAVLMASMAKSVVLVVCRVFFSSAKPEVQ